MAPCDVCVPPVLLACSSASAGSGMSLVDLDFGNKVPAGAAAAVGAAAAARVGLPAPGSHIRLLETLYCHEGCFTLYIII